MGAAGRVSADQHPAAQAAGQLREPEPGRLDVIGGRVRAGVARPQQERQWLARAFGAVVSEDGQRVMAVGFLPRGRGLLFLRARGHDRRVDVHGDQAAARAGRGVAGQVPGPLPGGGPCRADGLQRLGRVAGQAGDQPGDHRVRGHRPGQLWLRPQYRHVSQAVAAQRHRDRQVGDDLPRAVHGPGGPPSFQCCVQAAVQAGDPQRPGKQQATGLGDDSGAVSRHHDLGVGGGKLHAESAFRTGADRSLDKPYSSSSKALSVSKRSSTGRSQAKARG